MKEVDGLKYSCHASSILDTEDLTDQLAAVSVKNNKVCTALKGGCFGSQPICTNMPFNFSVVSKSEPNGPPALK